MIGDLLVGIKWFSKEYQHPVGIKFLPNSQGWVKYSIYRGYSWTFAESYCLSNCLADHFWMIIIAHCCSLLKSIDIHPKNYSLQFREYLWTVWRCDYKKFGMLVTAAHSFGSVCFLLSINVAFSSSNKNLPWLFHIRYCGWLAIRVLLIDEATGFRGWVACPRS